MSTLRLTNLQHTDASDPNIVLANDRTAALADGTASAPALSFQDDLDTGLYSPGANSIALGVGGSAILTIASTGNTTFTGAITTTSLSAQSTATNSWFQTGTNLGGADYVWAAKDTTANVWHSGLQTDGDLYIGGDLTGSNRIGLTGSTGAAFFATQNLDIESTGRLTIKRTTHSPAYGQDAFRILDRNASNVERVSMYADGKAVFGNTSGSYVQIAQNSGVTINDGAIDLYQQTQTATATPFKVQSDVGGSSGDKIEKFVILADGSVGIGKTSSLGAKLHVEDSSATDTTPVKIRNYKASVNTKAALLFECSTSGNQGGSAAIKGVCGTDAGGLNSQNDGGLEFQTSSGGAGTLATALLIIKYKPLQLPSNSPGIGFGSSTSADLLDDYEEGTWTPVLKSGTNTITYSGGDSQFTYTKVGRVVTVNFTLNNETTAGTTGGTFSVEGLPFAAISTQSNRFIGTIVNYYNLGLYLNGWPAYVHLDANQSKINVYYKTAANGQYDATTVSNVGGSSFMQWQITYFT